MPKAPESVPAPKKDELKKETKNINQAQLVVEFPADSKLFIDEKEMKVTPGRRTFRTPTLERGQLYYYMVRAELTRDGKPISETRRVIVRAGEESQVSFASLGTEATAATGK